MTDMVNQDQNRKAAHPTRRGGSYVHRDVDHVERDNMIEWVHPPVVTDIHSGGYQWR